MWVLSKEQYREIFHVLNDDMFERLYGYMDIFKSPESHTYLTERIKQLEMEGIRKNNECTRFYMKKFISRTKENILNHKEWLDYFTNYTLEVYAKYFKSTELKQWEEKYGHTIILNTALMFEIIKEEFPNKQFFIKKGYSTSYTLKFRNLKEPYSKHFELDQIKLIN